MAGKFVYDFLGGVRKIYFVEESAGGGNGFFWLGSLLIPLARWLIGLTLVLFATSCILSVRRQPGLLSAVRCGSKKRWWTRHFLNGFLTGLAAALGYWLVWHTLDQCFGLAAEEAVDERVVLLLWLGHLLTLVSLYCLLDMTAFSSIAPIILLVVEVVTLQLSFYFWNITKYMFGTWGMYVQTRWIDPYGGFRAGLVLLIEAGIIAACFVGGSLWIRRFEWR